MDGDIEASNGKQVFRAQGDVVTIGDTTFDLTKVTGVMHHAVRNVLNGAYQGTNFTVQLRQDDVKKVFLMHSNHRDEGLAENQAAYEQIVALLESTAIPRLGEEMAAAIRGGETVTIGPVGAKVTLSPDGVKKGGLFGKAVPWDRVTGIDAEGRDLRVWGRKSDGAEPKVVATMGTIEWNAWVLPRVVAALATG